MALTATAKNEALDAIGVNTIKLHSGNPGASGTANEIAGASETCTYGSAAAGARDLSSSVDVSVPLGATVSHFSLWEGATLKAYKVFDSNPETYANAGVARVTSAQFTLADAV